MTKGIPRVWGTPKSQGTHELEDTSLGDRESPKNFGGPQTLKEPTNLGAPLPPPTLPLFPGHGGDAHEGVALVLLGGECWGRGLGCCRPPGVAVGHSGPLLPLSCRCCHLLPDLGPCSPTLLHVASPPFCIAFLHPFLASPFSHPPLAPHFLHVLLLPLLSSSFCITF